MLGSEPPKAQKDSSFDTAPTALPLPRSPQLPGPVHRRFDAGASSLGKQGPLQAVKA